MKSWKETAQIYSITWAVLTSSYLVLTLFGVFTWATFLFSVSLMVALTILIWLPVWIHEINKKRNRWKKIWAAVEYEYSDELRADWNATAKDFEISMSEFGKLMNGKESAMNRHPAGKGLKND